MARFSTKDLRALQNTLNASIDAYEYSADAATAARITSAAEDIASLTSGKGVNFIGTGFRPIDNMAIRIAIDLDLFTMIEDRVTFEHLASKTGAAPNLLKRIIRLLVASKVLLEPTPKAYSATPLSRLFRAPSARDWMKMTWDTTAPIWLATPAWLRENGYNDVTDLENNPTKALHGKNFWAALAEDSRREADFASAMKIQDEIPKAFAGEYAWGEAAATYDASRSDVFLVDVGGGQGQYLSRVIEEHPGMPGRKIVQDLATVVQGIDDTGGKFEVQGARFYHLRGILHDWPDESCRRILRRVKDACAPGYSSILVHTIVLPDTGLSQLDARNDLNLWTCIGKERTKEEWESLFGEVGLRIERIIMPEAWGLSYMDVVPV